MKPFAAIILAALLLALTAQPAAAQSHSPYSAPLYLALGDSLAAGVEAPANNDGLPGYPDRILGRLLAFESSVSYTNLAVAGETSGSFLAGQMAAAESALITAAVQRRCVQAITINIGGNDFGRILTGETTAEVAIPAFEANFRTILGRLTNAPLTPGCGTRIATMDYYNPYPGLPIPPSNVPLADVYQPQLNAIIRRVSAEFGIPVANVATRFAGNEADLLYVNQGIYDNPLLRLPFTPWFEGNVDFHPRPAGHAAIADAFWAALGVVPNVPVSASLPDLLPLTVSFQTPWVCGECAPGNRVQLQLPELATATPNTIEWLGAQIWNRSTRPLICWLLALMQSGLNSYAQSLNQVAIPGLNAAYRLLYSQFFYLTSATSMVVLALENQRDLLWQLNGTAQAQLTAMQALSGQQFALADELGQATLDAWLSFVGGLSHPFSYLAVLYVDSMGSLLSIVGDLDSHKPPQLAAIADFWLFAAVIGFTRGLWESQLGWWVAAQIALLYLHTALVAVDSAGEL